MRCAVLCFVFLCVELARLADGLKSSEKGVCVTKHTVIKTKLKAVLVALNKWCGKKKCVAKQTRQQKYSVTNNQFVCCQGFMYQAATDSCGPVCSTGCANGTCISPNVCSCAPPTYLDPTTKNKCLTPTCDHPCINGQCSINNTCTCSKNFTIFNSTHCAPNCTEGYQLDSNLTCTPKCKNCTNGRCTAPGICTCDPGYKYVGTCEPQCDPTCANGLCTAPNTCKCSEGYIMNGTNCTPKCDACVNGRCTAPEVCECNEGYTKGNETCEPRCKEGCVNGRCVGPDVCACDDGFLKKNATVCLASCKDCKNNGTCMVVTNVRIPETYIGHNMNCGKDKRSKCPQPVTKKRFKLVEVKKEICCEGYQYDIPTDFCLPLCLHGCLGGKCVAPETCSCKAPLIPINNKCVHLVCDPPCINGNCTAPNTCTCDDGYLLKEDNFTCAAQCTDCANGKCTTPNVCECNKGFTMIENKCKPVCKNGCSNGFCSAPDVCSCNEGYEIRNNTCEPVCGVTCVNANCVAPNTCECLTGFEPKDTSKEVCQPKCDSCVNGDCIGPNKCSCHKGYALKDNVCRPICEDMCVNATCVEPNTCECFTGFEPTAAKGVCRPKCDSCVNGDCLAPNECICRKGYASVDKVCTATCKDECVNANCVAPNKCECFAGFEPKYGHEAVCMPKCDSCANGECVAPNKCVCRRGFTLINNVCRPTCEDECVNGNCTAPDKCTCNEGYTRNRTKPSVCYKDCNDCGVGACSTDGECICGTDSKRINGTCLSLEGIKVSGLESAQGLASLEISWLVGGAVGVLLIILVIVVIQRMWRRQNAPKTTDNGNTFGSVIYTLPDTLIRNNEDFTSNDGIDEEAIESVEEGTNENLMTQPNGIV